MQTKSIGQYFLFGLLFLMLILTFFLFKPFLIVLVLGGSLAIVLNPIYKWLLKYKLPAWLASLLVVLFFLIIVCGPLLALGVMVFNQSQSLYFSAFNGHQIYPFLDNINASINKYMPMGVSFDINQKISDFAYILSNNISQIFSTTLSTIFSFVLILFSIFYFLKDGTKWKQYIYSISPISDADDSKIIHKLKETVNGVIIGSLFVALCQGVMMGIGLYLFGIPNPALWAMVTGIASLIPYVGTAIVSIPAVIFLYSTGHAIQAVELLIWSFVFSGLISNFLSPIIIGRKAKIPEFIILLSVLGGIYMFGPVGILIGPITISMLHTFISIYKNDPAENKTV